MSQYCFRNTADIADDAKSVTVFMVWHAAFEEPACLRFSKTCLEGRVLSNFRQSLWCLGTLTDQYCWTRGRQNEWVNERTRRQQTWHDNETFLKVTFCVGCSIWDQSNTVLKYLSECLFARQWLLICFFAFFLHRNLHVTWSTRCTFGDCGNSWRERAACPTRGKHTEKGVTARPLVKSGMN